MTQNQIAWHNAIETKRHNQMVETETNRHQLKQEQLQEEANALQKRSIAVNEEHYARMDEINSMHYMRSDAETQRANRAREIETYRSDQAGEDIRRRANELTGMANAEISRHNAEMERIQESLNASMITKNLAEASFTSDNAGYIQARTWSELISQRGIETENALKEAQLATELSKSALNTAQVDYYNMRTNTGYLDAAANVVKTGSSVAKDWLSSGKSGINTTTQSSGGGQTYGLDDLARDLKKASGQ